MVGSVNNSSGAGSATRPTASQALSTDNGYLLAAMKQALSARLPLATSTSGMLNNMRPMAASGSTYLPVNPYAGDSLRPGGKPLISPFAFRNIPDIGVMVGAMKKAGFDFKPEEKKPVKKPDNGPASSFTTAKN